MENEHPEIFTRQQKIAGREFELPSDILEGRISLHDRKLLEASGPKLYKFLQDIDPFESIIIYPGTGARLIRFFVEGLSNNFDQQPKQYFLQVDNKENSSQLLNERVGEIMNNHVGKEVFIIDDYVTHRTTTLNSIKQALRGANVKEESIKLFALVGEKGIKGGADDLTKAELEKFTKDGYQIEEINMDLILPPDYYRDKGIEIGVLDPDLSGKFDFNRYSELKGTQKQPDSKYEQLSSKRTPALGKIRKNLRTLGEMIARKEQ